MDKQETLDKRELVIREMLVEEAVAAPEGKGAAMPRNREMGNLLLLVERPEAFENWGDLANQDQLEQQEMLELQMREQQEIPDRLDKHLLHSELHFLEVLEVLEVHVIPDKLEQEVLVEMVEEVGRLGWAHPAADSVGPEVRAGTLEGQRVNLGPIPSAPRAPAAPEVLAALLGVGVAVLELALPFSASPPQAVAGAVEDPKQGILEILEMQIMANLDQ
jgi:hypothetical protein